AFIGTPIFLTLLAYLFRIPASLLHRIAQQRCICFAGVVCAMALGVSMAQWTGRKTDLDRGSRLIAWR
ncbi:MAG: hypothetical protein SO111_02735, partial [Collinsella sp.]|nr:hypothetical protein [Collinsella sp.]